MFGRGRASVVLLLRRWRTRARCRATPCLSRLSCLPKRWPLAHEYLLLRRLTPVEVVWRPGDPPMDYRPGVRARQRCICAKESKTPPPGGQKLGSLPNRNPPRKNATILEVGAGPQVPSCGIAAIRVPFRGPASTPHVLTFHAGRGGGGSLWEECHGFG